MVFRNENENDYHLLCLKNQYNLLNAQNLYLFSLTTIFDLERM